MFSWWNMCFFFQLDYGCYDLSLRRAWISFHLLHILLFIEPLLSAHYRHLHQQPDLRSKIDLFFQFWHKPIWEYLGKGFIVKSCKILYLQFLELHATLPLIGDGWMHLLQNWCFLSSFKQQNGRGFLNKMYMLMHSFKMWRATNKLNYSSKLFETKWKAVPFRCLQANSTVFLWP